MPKHFRNIVVSHTNDYTADTHDQIKRWVEANGGRFSTEITSEVTHLIASSPAWKRYDNTVKLARKERTIHIVKFDWLEDSLSTKSRKPLDEKKYSWEPKTSNKIKKLRRLQQIRKRQALAEAASQDGEGDEDATNNIDRLRRAEQIRKAGVNFDKSCKEFQKEMAKVGYHPYKDDTGFIYMVTLLRRDVHADLLEKYQLQVRGHPPLHQFTTFASSFPGNAVRLYRFPGCMPFHNHPIAIADFSHLLQSRSHVHIARPWAECLQLYESPTQPRTYAVYLQYSKKGRRGSPDTVDQELAPRGSTFEFAFDMFRKIFEKKCELRWDERPAAGNEINLDGGDDEETDQKKLRWKPFRYLPPALGSPDGSRHQVSEMQPNLGSGVPMV